MINNNIGNNSIDFIKDIKPKLIMLKKFRLIQKINLKVHDKLDKKIFAKMKDIERQLYFGDISSWDEFLALKTKMNMANNSGNMSSNEDFSEDVNEEAIEDVIDQESKEKKGDLDENK